MDQRQEIYAELEALSEPASLPAPWNSIPSPPGFRVIGNVRAKVIGLLHKHGDQPLIDAGVVRADDGSSGQRHLRIHMPLGFPCWFLRRAPSEPPYDIVTNRDCLSGQLSLLAALEDDATQTRLKVWDNELFGTLDVVDAAVLHSLGLPAVPVSGLASLRGASLDAFCRCFDVRSLGGYSLEDEEDEDEGCETPTAPGDIADTSLTTAAPDASPSPQTKPQSLSLTLVDWHPAALDLASPTALSGLKSHLAALQENLDLLMDEIYVWQPRPDLKRKLRFALKKVSPKRLPQLIDADLDTSTRQLFERPRPSVSVDEPLTAANLVASLRNGDIDKERFKRDFSRYFSTEIIGKQLTDVAAEKCPEKKARKLVQAVNLDAEMTLLREQLLGTARRPVDRSRSDRR